MTPMRDVIEDIRHLNLKPMPLHVESRFAILYCPIQGGSIRLLV